MDFGFWREMRRSIRNGILSMIFYIGEGLFG